MRPWMREQPRVKRNQSLTAKQLVQLYVEEYRVEWLQLFLNLGIQRCATAKSQHAPVIRKNSTDKAALNLAESLPTQLDHQFTSWQPALIL